MMSKESCKMDMCNGPVLQKVIAFSLPLMLSSCLQLLFNAADVIVVGRFAGSTSLAAVGSTTELLSLLTTLFIGFSIGANVNVARTLGNQDDQGTKDGIHTAVSVSILSGSAMILLGFLFGRPMLQWMGTPADVIDKASLYLMIIFIGMPSNMAYNFGSAILRAMGDTKRPLYFLSAAGVLNVVLNLIFVILLHMDVAGVALATILSETLSAVLILNCLCRTDGPCHLNIRKLYIQKDQLFRMLRIGLPAGIQSGMFSFSNVLIQSSINSFGSIAMAGSTASANVEGFVYNAMNAVYQTTLSFTSQNYGAGKMDRVTKILLDCLGLVVLVGVVMGGGAVLLGPKLLQIYSSDPEVISYGMMRMRIINGSYFLCGIMDTMVGGLRGLGHSVVPMLVSLTGACLFRVVWIFSVFAMHRTVTTLYLSYPVSWIITFTAHIICYIVIRRRMAARRKSRDEI